MTGKVDVSGEGMRLGGRYVGGRREARLTKED